MQGGHNKVIDLKTETKMIFIMEISPIRILLATRQALWPCSLTNFVQSMMWFLCSLRWEIVQSKNQKDKRLCEIMQKICKIN